MLFLILAGCLAPIHGHRPVPAMYTAPQPTYTVQQQPGTYEVYQNPGPLHIELDLMTFGLLTPQPTYVIVEK